MEQSNVSTPWDLGLVSFEPMAHEVLSALKRPKHFNLGSVPRPDEIKRLWKVKREHAIAKKTIKPFNISQLITRLAHAGHLREEPDRLIASIFLVRIQN